jgi:hypothetical protein
LPEDKDTTSTLSLEANHKIKLSETNNNSSSVTLANDKYITLTDSTTGSNGTLTIGHKSYATDLAATSGTPKTLGYGKTFTVVTGVTRDDGGHLSGYETTVITMPQDTNETFALSGDAITVDKNVATITTSLTGSKNNNSTATLKVTSDNFTVSSKNNELNISMVWGSF